MENYEIFKNWLYQKNGDFSIENIAQKFNILKYIPLSIKFSTISTLRVKFEVDSFDDFLDGRDSDMLYVFQRYEILKTVFLVGRYLDIVFQPEDYTNEMYDLLQESGVVEYLQDNTDYDNLSRMCDDVIGIKNLSIIKNLNDTFERSDIIRNYNEVLKEFKKVMADEEVQKPLNKLLKFEEMNDPMLSDAIDNARKGE